jgi:hypothetical protein
LPPLLLSSTGFSGRRRFLHRALSTSVGLIATVVFFIESPPHPRIESSPALGSSRRVVESPLLASVAAS